MEKPGVRKRTRSNRVNFKKIRNTCWPARGKGDEPKEQRCMCQGDWYRIGPSRSKMIQLIRRASNLILGSAGGSTDLSRSITVGPRAPPAYRILITL